MSSAPPQRTPVRTFRVSPPPRWRPCPFPGPWPCPEASAWKDRERVWTGVEALGICSDTLRALEVPPGGAGGAQQAGPIPAGSGHCHPPPQLHAHQPHQPEDKGLYCLRPLCLAPHLSWPVEESVKEGRTHFLLLVLTPLWFLSGASPTGTSPLRSVEELPGPPAREGREQGMGGHPHDPGVLDKAGQQALRPPPAARGGPISTATLRLLCDLKRIKGHQQGVPYTQMFLWGYKERGG